MNTVWIIIPILLIRYGLLGLLDRESLQRAGLFAPVKGKEKISLYVYQITTIAILIKLLSLKIRTDSEWFSIGMIIYSVGLVLYTISIINYAAPKGNGINVNGLYRISRNPMYIAYFIYFIGCALLTHSWFLLSLLIVFQVSAHWIILSEERWCIIKFGEEYINYMNKVRRYI